jgi:hypothetical protein
MTPQEAFKFGFLMRCAEEGLQAEEIYERAQQALIKVANPGIVGAGVGAGASMAWPVVKGVAGLGQTALIGGLLASAGLGAGGGYMAAKLTEPDMDAEEAKTQELITTYQLFADEARRNAQRRQMYRQATPKAPRLLR